MSPDLVVPFCVRTLQTLWDPFDESIWRGQERPLSRSMVQEALDQGRLRATPYREATERGEGDPWTVQEHAERVAYLVRHGWADPVEADVGLYGSGVQWPLNDGHHRFAAAVFRGDLTIMTSASGSVDLIEDYYQYPVEGP